MWFPLPDSPSDILRPEGSAGLSASEIFELLCSAHAVEWRDKVGVAGSLDGSAKSTTRLLAIDGWVAKTDVGQWHDDPQLARAIARRNTVGRLASVWHPSKQTFAMRSQGKWHVASVCWELRTLRRLASRMERFQSWATMLELCIAVGRETGLGLDINPSNFGECPNDSDDDRLYYIDDEYYPEFSVSSMGRALVGRIPEEEDSVPSDWLSLGHILQPVLAAACDSYEHWSQLIEGIIDYPLVERYRPHQEALAAGIRKYALQRKGSRHNERRSVSTPLTCIIADVHANLPALDAVLAAAKNHGATDYIFLGDAVGYGPHPKQCIGRLAELEQVICIRGNHDHVIGNAELSDGMNSQARAAAEWSIAQLDATELAWLRDMPVEHRTSSWLCVHGAPRDPSRFFAYVYELTYEDNLEVVHQQDLQLCLYGHTHVPYVHRRIGKRVDERLGAQNVEVLRAHETLLVNPGSVGQPRDSDLRAAYALWNRHDNNLSFQRVPYDVAKTVRDLASADLPPDLIRRLEAGR